VLRPTGCGALVGTSACSPAIARPAESGWPGVDAQRLWRAHPGRGHHPHDGDRPTASRRLTPARRGSLMRPVRHLQSADRTLRARDRPSAGQDRGACRRQSLRCINIQALPAGVLFHQGLFCGVDVSTQPPRYPEERRAPLLQRMGRATCPGIARSTSGRRCSSSAGSRRVDGARLDVSGIHGPGPERDGGGWRAGASKTDSDTTGQYL
jgi:hypothetical protein